MVICVGFGVFLRFRVDSAQTIRPIFQSGTSRPNLVGPLGPFFFNFYFFDYCFILFMCFKIENDINFRTSKKGNNMSCIMRKSVFGISDQVLHKPDCTATEHG